MTYSAQDYENLSGIESLSEKLITNHLTLYQGYIKNINLLNDALRKIEDGGKFDTPEYAELNRRFGWEFNGMRLHELYFENINQKSESLDGNSNLAKTVIKEFGALDNFIKDFKSLGAIRGIGWVVLYYDEKADRLFNVWINEHDIGHLAGCQPLLVMDVFEHAYMLDYGIKKIDYIENFFKLIDWQVVEKRFGEI